MITSSPDQNNIKVLLTLQVTISITAHRLAPASAPATTATWWRRWRLLVSVRMRVWVAMMAILGGVTSGGLTIPMTRCLWSRRRTWFRLWRSRTVAIEVTVAVWTRRFISIFPPVLGTRRPVPFLVLGSRKILLAFPSILGPRELVLVVSLVPGSRSMAARCQCPVGLRSYPMHLSYWGIDIQRKKSKRILAMGCWK